jgi:hypothetical protein
LLTPVVHPANSQLATPSEDTPFFYWSIKPWFLTERKFSIVLIMPSSCGSQRCVICAHHESRPPVGLPLPPREAVEPSPLFRSGPHAGDHPKLAIPAVGQANRRSPETPNTPGHHRSRTPALHRRPPIGEEKGT